MVTGVSTGALIAPFAYLGPRYHDVLRRVYTSIGPKDVYEARSVVAALTTHKEEFDTAYMRKLFDYGYQLGVKGYPWQKTPPGYPAAVNP